tara:strand:- start:92 stop:433 length:342 start_codon:yes stop_codon:yes gene_type:complete
MSLRNHRRRGEKILVNGIEFPSIKAAATAYGIKIGTVYKRLQKGVPLKDAFIKRMPPNKTGVPKHCELLGLKFKSHQERNEYFGLGNRSIDLIEKRLTRGWSEQQDDTVKDKR